LPVFLFPLSSNGTAPNSRGSDFQRAKAPSLNPRRRRESGGELVGQTEEAQNKLYGWKLPKSDLTQSAIGSEEVPAGGIPGGVYAMNLKTRCWLAVLLPLLWAEGGLGADGTVPPASAVSPADWMASLPGNKRISELSIPGTHDAGALYEPWRGTTRCQTRTIPEQLEDGVRFLDIRCRDVRGKFQIYHGSVDQRLSFAGVLGHCFDFLQAHPKEFIIMSVKEEATPIGDTQPFEKLFDSYVAPNRDRWRLGDALPTVAEARGHVVLFRRFSATTLPEGIAAEPRDWQDSTNFWIRGSIRVQDEYVVTPGNQSAKWAAVQGLYQEMAATDSKVLCVNFSSGYESRWLPNIPAVADYMNPRLTDYFKSASPRRYGITVMDFEDAERCALIFRTNW
jgi:1-phosphatidylinositol phosphodiesterase